MLNVREIVFSMRIWFNLTIDFTIWHVRQRNFSNNNLVISTRTGIAYAHLTAPHTCNYMSCVRCTEHAASSSKKASVITLLRLEYAKFSFHEKWNNWPTYKEGRFTFKVNAIQNEETLTSTKDTWTMSTVYSRRRLHTLRSRRFVSTAAKMLPRNFRIPKLYGWTVLNDEICRKNGWLVIQFDLINTLACVSAYAAVLINSVLCLTRCS